MHWLALLAQAAATNDLTPWAAMGGSILGGSFTVWYAWWTASKTIPKIIEDHRAEQARLTLEFQNDVRAQRADFLAALEKQSSFHERVMDRLEKKIAQNLADNRDG